MQGCSDQPGYVSFLSASPKQMPHAVCEHDHEENLCKLCLERRRKKKDGQKQNSEYNLEINESGSFHFP